MRFPFCDSVDLAKLVVDIAKRFNSTRAELDAAQSVLVDRSLAQALAAMNDGPAAYALFSQLAKAHPNDPAIQEEYAHFLLESGDESYWPQALDQWRRVAARTRPRTDRWFRAKYSVALAQYKLQDKQGAAKLIRYLQATEDLRQSGMEDAFAELLEDCAKVIERCARSRLATFSFVTGVKRLEANDRFS